MKKLMIASMIAAAAMFTACDDDASSADEKVYTCDIKANLGLLGDIHACAEATDQSKITDVCGKVGELMKTMGVEDAATAGNNCPNGAKKTCDGKLDGVDYKAYFYTDEDAEADCGDLLKKVDQLK